jgi:hypothetical protein
MSQGPKPRRVVIRTREERTEAELRDLRERTNSLEYLTEEARRLAAYFSASADEERRQDALEILELIGDVSAELRDGNPEAAAVAAYWLGRMTERLGIWRPVENAAGVGHEVLEAAGKGGDNKRLSDAEKDRRRREWGAVVEELRRKNPELPDDIILDRAGRSLTPPVSGRTVRRALKPPEKSS